MTPTMNPVKQLPCVLVVEDERELASILKDNFEVEGFKVILAKDGVEGLNKINNQRFDSIVLDMRFAKGSGEDVIHAVRSDKNSFNGSTPIIVMSGFLDKHMVDEIKGRINAVFVKPFDPETLVIKVKELIAAEESS